MAGCWSRCKAWRHCARATSPNRKRCSGEARRPTELCADLSPLFDELASLAEALSTLGHVTPRSLDAIAAIGEMLSTQMVVAAYEAAGLPAVAVDARRVMVTDATYTRAEPQLDAIAAAVRSQVAPLVRAGQVPVIGGFVGATREGVTTTLGRGGSDYSASLIGAALGAEAIEIWTDVDGMLTADPRIVEDARLIEQIRFDEASELAAFGAKVLHPSTIAPAVKVGIPVFIYNTHNPHGAGTRITFDAPRRAGQRDRRQVADDRGESAIVAHAARARVPTPRVRDVRAAPDVGGRRRDLGSLGVRDRGPHGPSRRGARGVGGARRRRGRAVARRGRRGRARDWWMTPTRWPARWRPFSGIPIHMLSLSATGINLTVIVDADQVAPAMRRLHAAFFAPVAGTEPLLRVASLSTG